MVNQEALTLKQLRALAAVARSETLAQAAEIVGVTAPAISTQIKTLEGHLGGPVLERTRDGSARLTSLGRETLAVAEQVDNLLDQYVKRVDALRAGKVGHVAIGAVSTGKYFAPHLVGLAHKQFPDIDISLHIANRDGIIDALAARRIDFAIMGRPPRQPLVEADLIAEHPHVLIAAPTHPLAGRRDIMPADLLAEKVLCREQGSGTRILSDRYFDRIGEGQAYDRAIFDSNETIKQAVMAGLGIAMISEHTVEMELALNRLVSLAAPGLPIIRHWYIIYRRDVELSPAAAVLRRFILDQNGAFIPGLEARPGG